jgi:2-methylisocitrate lyase-like PEP mutase family enzyme
MAGREQLQRGYERQPELASLDGRRPRVDGEWLEPRHLEARDERRLRVVEDLADPGWQRPALPALEGGYDLAPDDLVDALLDAGAVGCNIEDTDHATGDRLLDAEPRAAYLAAIRAAADRRGVGIVLNARIDAIIRHPQRDPADAMDEVLRRARLYLDAGADCVYPISLRDPALVAQVVKELDRPVNVNPSEPLAALAGAGAARISLGGGVHHWMMGELERRARRLLAGDGTAFVSG